MEAEPMVSSVVPKPTYFPAVGATPGPRCGHTIIALLGPNGDLSKARLVLFGGANALEGSTPKPEGVVAPAPPANGIRLAGATNDVHIMDVQTGNWEKVVPAGEPPSPRAAHAAVAVGNMMVIQGGIGPAGLASEDLHVLDFTDPNQPRWHRVVVQGTGPCARYAHTLSLVANCFLVVVGGNDGKAVLGDAWALDTSEKPYQWRKIEEAGQPPSARMYASAASRHDGLLLVCGGRDASGTALSDAYGLARHRDGRWDWHAAPGQMPMSRYQHAAVFVGARLHVSGGAIGGGRMVDEASAVLMLDTATGTWSSLGQMNAREDYTRRCRHAVAAVGPFVFWYGGLRGSTLLDDLLLADDADDATEDGHVEIGDPNSLPWQVWRESGMSKSAAVSLIEKASEEAAAISALVAAGGRSRSIDLDSASTPDTLARQRDRSPTMVPNVELSRYAVLVPKEEKLRGLVRQLSIGQLDNEGARVSPYPNEGQRPMNRRSPSMAGVAKKTMNELLRPRTWKPPDDRSFVLTADEILDLCDAAERIFLSEKTVLQLHAPVKIFGDLHGQFGDLMRLFEEYGSPSAAGDITYIDYLFLGDYVDRGSHSLETITLLLALKVEHASHVHLIRGNHEAADINALFGFRLECVERLGDEDGIMVWHRFNRVFNAMPLAAVIEQRIICMHGGIGRTIKTIDQIAAIERPLSMEDAGPALPLLMDLLWSDPTTNDNVQGVQPSPRGPGLVTFGPDCVKEFCKTNNLQMIVRAHECVMDGFERFAQGHLITLFSATNYCGTANNAGAILVLGRDLVMVPKLIHPLPPQPVRSPADEEMVEDGNWLQSINDARPPTPPRGRPTAPANNNLEYF